MNRPTETLTALQGGVGDTQFSTPIPQCVFASVPRQQVGSALIDSLRCGRGPSAIIRRIAAIIIDAINRVLIARPWTHVGVKGFKRVQPTLTHRDAAFAVPMEVFARRSGAAVDHSGPSLKLSRVRHAVRDRSGSQLLHTQASTRMRSGEVCDLDRLGVAAFAAAMVGRSSGIGTVQRENGQPSVFVSDWQKTHTLNITLLCLCAG